MVRKVENGVIVMMGSDETLVLEVPPDVFAVGNAHISSIGYVVAKLLEAAGVGKVEIQQRDAGDLRDYLTAVARRHAVVLAAPRVHPLDDRLKVVAALAEVDAPRDELGGASAIPQYVSFGCTVYGSQGLVIKWQSSPTLTVYVPAHPFAAVVTAIVDLGSLSCHHFLTHILLVPEPLCVWWSKGYDSYHFKVRKDFAEFADIVYLSMHADE
ncbi:hypothetical protein F5Y19DRAFT_473409 [Xylariaceae sp. FL1651]|nr:hypothetical protein F5Y19DRAFT_473409 [Xylariaceae sp. FL1651]